MSDEFKKALDTALSRIASMEHELSSFRNRKPEASAPVFDPDKFKSAFFRDPIGTLRRMGATDAQIQHSTAVHVAHGLGDQAPQELKMLTQMGPQIDATHALASQVTSLSQQLESLTKAQTQKGERERLNALISDKQKYPNLAKALAADSKFVDDDFQHGGSAEDIAAAAEARLAKVASIFVPQTASSESAATTGQSKQTSAGIGGDVPPLPKAGDSFDHNAVRDELVRKYGSQ